MSELPTVQQKCETCRFWKAKVKCPFVRPGSKIEKWDTLSEYEDLTDNAAGLCRRYPKERDKYTYDWCGEWKPANAGSPDDGQDG